MNILISTDSISDLPKEILKEHKIEVLPLPITLSEKTYLDGIEVNNDTIFEHVEKTNILPKTSAINEFTYKTFFKEQLKKHKTIIHFTISSNISSCYNNALVASQDLENVFVIDSKNLSSGVGLQILHAINLREQNKTAQEIVNHIEKIKPLVNSSFVIEKLDYLHKGGRCSSVQLLGANLLKLRPSILVQNGEMVVGKKYKGKMKNAIEDYIKDTLKNNTNIDNSMCFITYSSATDEILTQAVKSVEKFGNFEKTYLSVAGSTITSHCGPNTLGILFINKTN